MIQHFQILNPKFFFPLVVVPEIESLSSKRQLSGSRKIKETKATKRKAAEMLEVKEPKKILIETTKTPRGRKKAKSPEKSPKVVRGRSKSVASITLEVALPKLRSRRGESSPVQNNTEGNKIVRIQLVAITFNI